MTNAEERSLLKNCIIWNNKNLKTFSNLFVFSNNTFGRFGGTGSSSTLSGFNTSELSSDADDGTTCMLILRLWEAPFAINSYFTKMKTNNRHFFLYQNHCIISRNRKKKNNVFDVIITYTCYVFFSHFNNMRLIIVAKK